MQPLWTADLIGVFLAIILLWQGADFLVKTASKIATKLGLSDLVIGLTIVAIGTSAPEFVVSVGSALSGQPDIALANVVGSNIFNLGIILGVSAIFQPIVTSPKVLFRDGLTLLVAAMLVYFFLFGLPWVASAQPAVLNWQESAVLVVLLILYVSFLLIQKEKGSSVKVEANATWKDGAILVLSMLALGGGGHLLVGHATSLALQFNISTWWIGLTVVAIGTSSPEIATTCLALINRKNNIALGNLLGSDLFNILGVVGLAGLVSGGLVIDDTAIQSLHMLLGTLLVLLVLIRVNWKISRISGIILLVLNSLRWYFA